MEIIQTILSALIAQGPLGILAAVGLCGWLAVAWLLKNQKGRKDDATKLRDAHLRETKKIHDEYQKKLEELNMRNAQFMIETTDKRVEDVKELTDDYNELATKTLETLDRLIFQLEVRRTQNGNNQKEGPK